MAFERTETQGFSQRFGEGPRYTRSIVERSDEPPISTLAFRADIYYGQPYPFGSGELKCTEIEESVSVERDDETVYVTTLAATYSLDDSDAEVNPLFKPDVWSFQTQGASVPALFYFDNSGQMRPLTNSAFDYLKGLSVDEAQTKVVIRGNRASFPNATATAITNAINSGAYLGAPAHSWKCQGITGERKVELFLDAPVAFWEVTVELMYRQTGWNLLIPDVGFNYIENGTKKRATVTDPDTGEKLASADVVGLNGGGGLSLTGAPAILTRRVYKEVDFSAYFGTPPP